ncbi:hypothetical protein K0X99_001263 [Enterococcus faecium]|uniref:hypothetical protein n=1 Tax=Enterococcus faecium TaxID=1352 RepID=UPI000330F10C|nr:hypothetical protein [Enterococcus faecium]EME8227524.1 hypothetical protein [Enterococcus faecium]EOM69364.1 hypothetical protein SKE_00912 [Enterococcus faecium EnGen0165]
MITFNTCSRDTFLLMKDNDLLEAGNTLYSVDGCLFNGANPIQRADLDLPLTYRRNYLPKSAIVDGKATLTLIPNQQYVLIRYWSEQTGTADEPIFESKREIIGEYTATAKLGKVSLTDLDDTSAYKLAVEETDYTPASEDILG